MELRKSINGIGNVCVRDQIVPSLDLRRQRLVEFRSSDRDVVHALAFLGNELRINALVVERLDQLPLNPATIRSRDAKSARFVSLSTRKELGRTAVLDPQSRDRRELRVRRAQRRSGNRSRQKREGSSERDVDTCASGHLDRFGQHQLPVSDVNNDNFDLDTVSFVSQ